MSSFTENSPVPFTVTYCANCDGGAQELGAASEAIKRAFPNAVIANKQLQSYPIEVVVYYNGHVLWRSHQRNLFKKYGKNRTASQAEIVAAVSKLLDDEYAASLESPADASL